MKNTKEIMEPSTVWFNQISLISNKVKTVDNVQQKQKSRGVYMQITK